MSCLSYNCQGLEKAREVVRLTNLVRREDPKVIFLMETKCERKRMEGIRLKLGFENCFTVDCRGKSGGLCLMWDSSVKLTIKSYTSHHIDAMVEQLVGEDCWRLTGIYGWPQERDKHFTVDLVKKLSEETNGAWACIGDFNHILTLEDKKGGNGINYGQLVSFREALDDCELNEITFSGPRFTWDNGRKEDEFIQERLDYAFANEPWLEKYPGAMLVHLCREGSDHIPIMLYPLRIEMTENNKRTGARPHRFESLWAADEGYEIIVRNAWCNPNFRHGPGGVSGQVDHCMKELRRWNKIRFGNVMEKLQKVREELRDIHKNGVSGRNIGRRRELEKEENTLMDQEERIWFQRARENELKWGDRNSRFFHSKANRRQKRNKLTRLIDDEGMSGEVEMGWLE